jgi:hypothetical protein
VTAPSARWRSHQLSGCTSKNFFIFSTKKFKHYFSSTPEHGDGIFNVDESIVALGQTDSSPAPLNLFDSEQTPEFPGGHCIPEAEGRYAVPGDTHKVDSKESFTNVLDYTVPGSSYITRLMEVVTETLSTTSMIRTAQKSILKDLALMKAREDLTGVTMTPEEFDVQCKEYHLNDTEMEPGKLKVSAINALTLVH